MTMDTVLQTKTKTIFIVLNYIGVTLKSMKFDPYYIHMNFLKWLQITTKFSNLFILGS